MRNYLLIFLFLILTWQGIVISNTLATRLEERTQQVHQLLQRLTLTDLQLQHLQLTLR